MSFSFFAGVKTARASRDWQAAERGVLLCPGPRVPPCSLSVCQHPSSPCSAFFCCSSVRSFCQCQAEWPVAEWQVVRPLCCALLSPLLSLVPPPHVRESKERHSKSTLLLPEGTMGGKDRQPHCSRGHSRAPVCPFCLCLICQAYFGFHQVHTQSVVVCPRATAPSLTLAVRSSSPFLRFSASLSLSLCLTRLV